jgi:predicted PurR-regulated permease PerM
MGVTPSVRETVLSGKSVVLVVLLLLVWQVRVVLLVVFAGILGAVLLRSISTVVARRTHLHPRSGLLVVIALSALIISVSVWFRGSAIADEFAVLGDRLPSALRGAMERLQQQEWARLLMTHAGVQQVLPYISGLFWRATGMIWYTAGTIGALVIALVLSIYLAAEPDAYLSGLVGLFPRSKRPHIKEMLDSLFETLQWWLLARFFSMIAVGVIIGAGLWLLEVPMAGTLAAVAGLLTFVPNIGPVISALPAILFAFNVGPQRAVYVALLFWGAHILEGMLITPLLERKAVRLRPALTLSVQLVLAILTGPAGVTLAAPLTLVGISLRRMLVTEHEFGDLISVSPGSRLRERECADTGVKV